MSMTWQMAGLVGGGPGALLVFKLQPFSPWRIGHQLQYQVTVGKLISRHINPGSYTPIYGINIQLYNYILLIQVYYTPLIQV